MKAIPKPEKPEKAPRKRIRTRRPLGTVRREAKAGGDITPEQWDDVCDFYRSGPGYLCAYCGCLTSPLLAQVEHVKPLSKGGRQTAANMVISCPRCNAEKGTRTWAPKLRHPLMVQE